METVKDIIDAQQVWGITGAWIHNGELFVQTTDTKDLVVVGRFVAVAEKPKRKERKARAKKNGLARGVLAENSDVPF